MSPTTPTPLTSVPIAVMKDAVRGTTFLRPDVAGVAPVRLPEWTRVQHTGVGITFVSDQASGVHLDIVTAATTVELTVDLERINRSNPSARSRFASFVSLVNGEQSDRVDLFDEGSLVRITPEGVTREPGDPVTVTLALGAAPAGERSVQVWLPHNAVVTVLGVRADAAVRPAAPSSAPRWVHYGSSISHGIDADGPLGTWPVVAARHLGWQLTNLGFSGQAMLDPFVARTIRDLEADIITLKVGINTVSSDVFRERTFVPALHGFLDTVREGHPTTPIVLMSSVFSTTHEHVPGPSVLGHDGVFVGTPAGDRVGVLTLHDTRALFEHVAAVRADAALTYLDGRTLFGEADAHLLLDGVHPDDAGLVLMGTRFAERMRR